MSTTDTRASFEAHYRKECGMPDSAAFQWDAPYMVAALDGWQAALAWQAATEAAKATGTAGEVEHIHSPGEQADIGKRIRRVAKASGYVPDGTDEFYYAAAFAILGRAADALEQAARQPAPILTEDQKLRLRACILTGVAFEIVTRSDADAILAATNRSQP